MKSSSQVIAVFTDWYHEYQAKLVELAADELNTAGYGVVCIAAGDLQVGKKHSSKNFISNSIYKEVNNFGFHGLISLSGTFGEGVDSTTISNFLKGFDLPMVSLGLEVPEIPSVSFNQTTGMIDLMQHLLAARDRKEFVFIRGLTDDPYSLQREKIFRNSLIEAGHQSQNIHYLEGDYNSYTTYRLVTELLSQNKNIDCIVAANDVMAASAARAAKAHHLSIPHDISVSGFDDTDDATNHSPAITTVRQPLKKITTASIKLLLKEIDDSTVSRKQTGKSTSIPTSIIIDTELVVRSSTSAAATPEKLQSSLDIKGLEEILTKGMHGLQPPETISIPKLAELLGDTLFNGSSELLLFASELELDCITEHRHWWKNLCDHIESISDQKTESQFRFKNMTLVDSALSKLRKRIWAIEMDESFESSRMQNVKSILQLSMSSSNNMDDILAAMEEWLEDINPKRCFLASYTKVGNAPDTSAKLIHIHCGQEVEAPAYRQFKSEDILPKPLRHELSKGLLVFSPVYTQNLLSGYLLIDPSDIKLPYLDIASVSIGNAMRTQHHLSTLQNQKDSLQAVNVKLEKAANFDALTGLANRFQFQRKLNASIDLAGTQKHSLSLLFIDLDGFKKINDTLGHATGDELLVRVAITLKDSLCHYPESDYIISRLGGDEFTILLTHNVASPDNRPVTDKILKGLSATFHIDNHAVNISASIGCAIFPQDAGDSDTLLKHADLAMYQAKSTGKNQTAYFDASLIVNKKVNKKAA